MKQQVTPPTTKIDRLLSELTAARALAPCYADGIRRELRRESRRLVGARRRRAETEPK